MLSKSNAKLIKSLQLKKYRLKEKLFIVEGAKTVSETLKSSYKVNMLFITEKFLKSYNDEIPKDINCQVIGADELTKISEVKTNEEALAVVGFWEGGQVYEQLPLTLALDDIRDPGNLGTILRVADWYGIKQVIASPSTVDFYSPKTIRASMGSFLRVGYRVLPLTDFFGSHPEITVYGALLKGENAQGVNVVPPACLLIGNESQGIGESLKQFVHRPVTIARSGGAESLNAAMATAILCDNFTRLLKK